ncbi:S1C family serine protease [Deinococcus sp. Marseille-Q6407]|uniref:S1C family serine protease n=1 Tax=Deinococcus sp. Marseille-Q6407 TaxID=2969223 RepID=UPI0021C17D67|nr:trypsin-like peptidase domain-containing protein [Deinococcus sp. Marseille-Q6407]
MNRVLPVLGVTALLAAGAYGGYQFAELRGEPAQVVRLDPAASETATASPAQAAAQTPAPAAEAAPAARVSGDGAAARTESERNTAGVVRSSSDGLVFVETTSTVQPNLQQQMLDQLFGHQGQGQPQQPQEAQGLGSGFFVTDSGDILTNYHVVQDASEINIRLHKDARSYPAEVVGTAPDYDLALIRAKNLPKGEIHALPLGDDKQLEVGLKAIALGAPFGLDFSVSEGIISSLERQAPVGVGDVLQPVIQTDAAINPGNSGGPLLNSAGQVVGVNTQILTGGVGQSAGVGFAIPVSTVKQLLPQLQAGQHIKTPVMGLSMLDLSSADPKLLQASGLPSAGVLVTRVYPGSPAATAGLRATEAVRRDDGTVVPSPDSDILTAVDGHKIESSEDIRTAMIGKRVGDTVTLSVQRGKQTSQLKLKLTDFHFN